MSERKRTTRTIRANLIAGVLTVIPLVVVWLVLAFVFSFLFAVGSPVATGFTMFITDRYPTAAPLLTDPIFQWLVAIIAALLLRTYGDGIYPRDRPLAAARNGLLFTLCKPGPAGA